MSDDFHIDEPMQVDLGLMDVDALDQLHAGAIDQLRACTAFVLVVNKREGAGGVVEATLAIPQGEERLFLQSLRACVAALEEQL